MRTVDTALFELPCEELGEELARSARPLVVTENGRPVAALRSLAQGRRPGGKAGRGGADDIRHSTGGRSSGRI